MNTEPRRKRISKTERQTIYGKYNGHCAYCGQCISFKEMQVDHLIPMRSYEKYLAKGIDIDTMDNYMPACRSCNKYKSVYDLEGFRKMIERQPEILLRDRPTYALAVRFGVVTPTPKRVVFYFESFESKEL